MKAALSTPNGGPIFYEGDTLCFADGRTFAAPYAVSPSDQQTAAEAAIREAERLVAHEASYAVLLPVWRRPVCKGEHEAWAGLAEALAAFVMADF